MGLNKGEWSEVYTFLKLLADGRLYAADADLNRINDIYYPVLNILRKEPDIELEFSRDTSIEVLDSTGEILFNIPIEEFKLKSEELLYEIQNAADRAFDLPNIVNFMHSIRITKLTAGSTVKRDITIVVHDIYTGYKPTLGFSIKSKLGSASTLINASGATNFIYKLSTPLALTQINEINNIETRSKIKDRTNAIIDHDIQLEYWDMQSVDFKRNLTMIDSKFPIIISEMLKSYFKGEAIRTSELTEQLKLLNPCNYDLTNNHPYYEYKVKNFLTDCALGMTPRDAWIGKYDATGGYIVVKEDGEVLCYHIYNRNEFQEYLYNNTKFETASSSRHSFGSIYEEDGEQFFKLNLQVRFL